MPPTPGQADRLARRLQAAASDRDRLARLQERLCGQLVLLVARWERSRRQHLTVSRRLERLTEELAQATAAARRAARVAARSSPPTEAAPAGGQS